jgi:hypothetical protein
MATYSNIKTRLLCALVILTSAFVFPDNSTAQLTGSVRNNFFGEWEKKCYDTQRGASVNKNTPNDTLRKYCSCMATAVADTLSNTYVDEMEKGNIPMSNLVPLMQQAANYCTRKLNPNLFK